MNRKKTIEKNTLEEIYNKYYDVIYNIIYYKTRNYQLAEDMTHDIIIKAMDKIAAIDNVRTYLLQSTRNTLINYFNREKQTDNIAEKEIKSDEIQELEIKLLINAALDYAKPSKVQRAIIDLKYKHKYTIEQIASELDIGFGKVVYQYEKIEKKMKEYFKTIDISGIRDVLDD